MRKSFHLTFLMWLALASFVSAQVAQGWVSRYNGGAGGQNQSTALAVDALGNVYVTGSSWGGPATFDDYATIKYSPGGVQEWVARYDGPAHRRDNAAALALDSDGNVYVTGSSIGIDTGLDYATIKYDPFGRVVWTARYDGPLHGPDEATAMTVDSNGNVYVTGSSYSGGTSDKEFATVSYDADGNQLWVARYRGPVGGANVPTAMAVDASGNVYVTGFSYGGSATNFDYATIKYDSTGQVVWTARYDGPDHLDDLARALAMDEAGNIYVTGSSQGAATFQDYFTIKYSPGGEVLWTARYDGPPHGPDWATAIALDGNGYIYVTGYSYGGLETHYDYVTIQYEPLLGQTQWITRYDGPSHWDDKAVALLLDGDYNVYVTGQSCDSAISGADCSDSYFATLKYGSDGGPVWTARYAGPLHFNDGPAAMALDVLRRVYVTGHICTRLDEDNGCVDSDYATVQYIQP